jgi:hypothetical protein
MTTQPDHAGSDRDDAHRHGGAGREAEVDRRPDTAGYPSSADAGGAVVDEPSDATDERDRAGYPDAGDAAQPT